MNVKEAKLFVARFVTGDHTPEEYAAFLQWLEGASSDELGVIADEHEALQEHWLLSTAGPSSEWVEQLEQKLDRTDGKKRQAVIRNMYARRGFRWIAAASVLTFLAGGGYWWYSHQAGNPLNPSGSGVASSNKPIEALSKLFSTSKGGSQQQFELADGSKVWLNAASSLKVPASFPGKERNVELSGEAYFEVAKNADKPFRIQIRDAKIEVLGTQINVMAYEDEPVSKTTLVEGAIKVVRGSEELSLQPGEQAEIAYPLSGASTPIKLNRDVKQSSILSWKSGYLDFNNDELHTVMREIARCYDLEVKYEGEIPERRFTGNFSRKTDFHEILQQLKEFQHINFRVAGKTITVTS
jgi:ferric-dicitrate binding protein FerR (iron transport regulator)